MSRLWQYRRKDYRDNVFVIFAGSIVPDEIASSTQSCRASTVSDSSSSFSLTSVKSLISVSSTFPSEAISKRLQPCLF